MEVVGQAIIFTLKKNLTYANKAQYWHQVVYYKKGWVSMFNLLPQEAFLLGHRKFHRVCNLNQEEFDVIDQNFGKNPVCVLHSCNGKKTEGKDKTVFVSDDPKAIILFEDHLDLLRIEETF